MAVLFGAALGSFASVLIARAHNPRLVVWQSAEEKAAARSACPHCGRALTVLDLLPVFGWLLAGGKCRSCKQPIGLHYLIYELAGAGAMAWAFILAGFGAIFLAVSLAVPFLIAVIALLLAQKPIPAVYWLPVAAGVGLAFAVAM